jgi:hypothetical protein
VRWNNPEKVRGTHKPATAARIEKWWARQDSNLQPDRYERPALTIELQAPGAQLRRKMEAHLVSKAAGHGTSVSASGRRFIPRIGPGNGRADRQHSIVDCGEVHGMYAHI